MDTPSSLSRLMPSYHFKGIAARTVKTYSGERAVALELLHKDEEACILLLVSRDLNNILLDWRLWADIYNLPMLMISEDNRVIVVKDRSDLRRFFARRCILNKSTFYSVIKTIGFTFGDRKSDRATVVLLCIHFLLFLPLCCYDTCILHF